MKNAYSRKNEAKAAVLQQKQKTKLISQRFPNVSSIVVKLTYTSDGSVSLTRTLNFYPENHAFFKTSCLGEDCENGGLDLSRYISAAIKNGSKTAKGDVRCANKDPEATHAAMSYRISIKYN
jgi:hypothetical protein